MAQLRIRTEGDLVYIGFTEDPKEGDASGDFSLSMKWYGPFKSADEQRAFMLSYIDGAPISDEEKTKFGNVIRAWRRFDEESVEEPG